MSHLPQIKVPATYLRGGTSKGVFFRLQDLPAAAQVPGEARDQLFMRVIGSPDPYAAHIDGMGGATSSTSKCVILSKARVPDPDFHSPYSPVSLDKAFGDLDRHPPPRPSPRPPRAPGGPWPASGKRTSPKPSSPTCP